MTVITENKLSATDMHFELKLWLNEFKFYKEEIKIFNRKLEDIVKKRRDMEVMKDVEHFQNQYIRQIEVIDELRHDVKQYENALEKEIKLNPTNVDQQFFEDHSGLNEEVVQFKKIYNELKREFMGFLSGRV
jgi:hypothetical protein